MFQVVLFSVCLIPHIIFYVSPYWICINPFPSLWDTTFYTQNLKEYSFILAPNFSGSLHTLKVPGQKWHGWKVRMDENFSHHDKKEDERDCRNPGRGYTPLVTTFVIYLFCQDSIFEQHIQISSDKWMNPMKNIALQWFNPFPNTWSFWGTSRI